MHANLRSLVLHGIATERSRPHLLRPSGALPVRRPPRLSAQRVRDHTDAGDFAAWQAFEVPGAPGLRGLRSGEGPSNCWWIPALGLPTTLYLPLLSELAAAGLAPCAIDLAGFGVSKLRVRSPAFSHHLVLVRKALARTRQPILLAAHSISALLAVELARQEPERVCGLILSGFGRLATPGHWRRQLRLAAAHPERLISSRTPGRLQNSLQLRQELTRARVCPAYESFLDEPGVRALETGLRGVSVPTLLWHGEHDRMVPLEAVTAASRECHSAQLEPASGCGHMAPLEQPTACAQAHERFAERIALGSAATP